MNSENTKNNNNSPSAAGDIFVATSADSTGELEANFEKPHKKSKTNQ